MDHIIYKVFISSALSLYASIFYIFRGKMNFTKVVNAVQIKHLHISKLDPVDVKKLDIIHKYSFGKLWFSIFFHLKVIQQVLLNFYKCVSSKWIFSQLQGMCHVKQTYTTHLTPLMSLRKHIHHCKYVNADTHLAL